VNKWLVTLVNMEQPFDKKEVVVSAPTISEAFDEKVHGHPTYYPRSARYHKEENLGIIAYLDKLVNIAH
jgi:hypothetical protein